MIRFSIPFLVLLAVLTLEASSEGSLPSRGDSFRFHQETISTGTATFGEAAPFEIEQDLHVTGQALVLRSEPETGVRVRYTFDEVKLRLRFGSEPETNLTILPGKVVIDGTPVYDRETNPDIPVGLLDLVINEEIVLDLDSKFEVKETHQFRKNRTVRSYFNLLSVVRQTIVPIPPEGVSPGEPWILIRPLTAMGGDFVLPATETFQLNRTATSDNPVRVLQKTVTAKLSEPKTVPIRMGMLTDPSLQFDALGPNIQAPPPPVLIESFEYDSQEILEFDTQKGFPSRIGSIAQIHMTSQVPPPDGIEKIDKSLLLRRRTLTTLDPMEGVSLTQEQEDLFLGGAK